MSHLGIITALTSEAACFTSEAVGSVPLKLGNHASLILSGIGQEAAMAAAEQLLDSGATILISCGMAGALSPALRPGDLLLPARICADSSEYYACDETWRRYLRQLLVTAGTSLHEGDLYSSTTAVADAGYKTTLGEDTGTIAVDMESAAIMEFALSRQVPAVVLRSVIDPADFTLPQYILDGCNRYGEISPLYLLKSLIMNPLRSITLLRLAACHRRASSALAVCADKLLQAQKRDSSQATQEAG